MRLLVSFLLFCCAAFAAGVQQETVTPAAPGILSTGGATIYCRMGVLTTVTVLTDKPITAMKGGPEIDCVVEGNLLRIQPRVEEGYTNIHLTIEGVVYPLIIRISLEEPPTSNPTFTVEGAADPFDGYVRNARPMKPSSLDVSGLIAAAERSVVDEAYRSNLKAFRSISLHRAWQWNGCTIHLSDVFQFADKDLLLFRVVWRNATDSALYLHAKQVQLWLGREQVPVAVRSQNAPTPIIYPGQVDTVWLFVQGHRLKPDQDWVLQLPPEASEIAPLVRVPPGQ